MESFQSKLGPGSTGLVDFAETNRAKLVRTLLDPGRSEKFQVKFGFVSKKHTERLEAERREFGALMKSLTVPKYIAQLLKSKTFLTRLGREQVADFLTSAPQVDARLRRDVG